MSVRGARLPQTSYTVYGAAPKKALVVSGGRFETASVQS